MIRTAIFGGSFNPVHLGHLGLARKVLEKQLADEVWLMVSPQNPLKPNGSLLDENVRFHLASIAVENETGIKASRFEFNLPRPSYTFRTMESLCQTYTDREFSLLIGADNWAVFDRWAHHDELLAKYPIIVYPREDSPLSSVDIPKNVSVLDAKLLPVSSTEIRRRISAGEDCSALMPPQVFEEIKRRGYYKM